LEKTGDYFQELEIICEELSIDKITFEEIPGADPRFDYLPILLNG
jgi:hypothetical protein